MSTEQNKFSHALHMARTVMTQFLKFHAEEYFTYNTRVSETIEMALYATIGRIDVLQEAHIDISYLNGDLSREKASERILRTLYQVCLTLERLHNHVRHGLQDHQQKTIQVAPSVAHQLEEVKNLFMTQFPDYWISSDPKTVSDEELRTFDLSMVTGANVRHPTIKAYLQDLHSQVAATRQDFEGWFEELGERLGVAPHRVLILEAIQKLQDHHRSNHRPVGVLPPVCPEASSGVHHVQV